MLTSFGIPRRRLMMRTGEAQPVAAARAARSRPMPRSRTARIQVVDHSHRQAAKR